MSSVNNLDAISAGLARNRQSGPPAEMLQAAQQQRANNPRPTAEQLAANDHLRDKGWTGQEFKPAGNFQQELSRMAGIRDAARTIIVPENANLHVLRFAYTTGKPNEVWIQNPPADNKLKLRAIMTPSWHVGSNEQQMQANGERYARSNTYTVEVRYADGTSQRKQVGIKNPPEYATASEVLEIDLTKKGDIRVSGWPTATGAGGYTEGRVFVIHNK